MKAGNSLSQREVLVRCRKAGARIERGTKHYKIFVPGGGMVVMAVSGSDSWRGMRNTVAHLKHAGLDIR